jgi:hypothetical protein
MTIQLSVAVRNARLDSIETTVGVSAILQIRSGAPPASCAAANTGTLCVQMALPADWMAAASSGQKSKTGSWTGTGDAGAGAGTNAGHYRIFDSTLATCHEQGTVTATGGGGDMTVDNVSIASGQTVTVNTKTLTDANS